MALLHALTPEQRQNMLKMGPASVDFVAKTRSYSAPNADFQPTYLDPAFVLDADALAGFAPLHQLLSSLDTDSTMMTAGSDAYLEALQVYSYGKMLAENATPSAQAAYDDLNLPNAPNRAARKKPAA